MQMFSVIWGRSDVSSVGMYRLCYNGIFFPHSSVCFVAPVWIRKITSSVWNLEFGDLNQPLPSLCPISAWEEVKISQNTTFSSHGLCCESNMSPAQQWQLCVCCQVSHRVRELSKVALGHCYVHKPCVKSCTQPVLTATLIT